MVFENYEYYVCQSVRQILQIRNFRVFVVLSAEGKVGNVRDEASINCESRG